MRLVRDGGHCAINGGARNAPALADQQRPSGWSVTLLHGSPRQIVHNELTNVFREWDAPVFGPFANDLEPGRPLARG